MKIKVDNRIYDPNRDPVMVILSEADKRNIADMPPEATRYAAFPEGMSKEDAEKFMEL